MDTDPDRGPSVWPGLQENIKRKNIRKRGKMKRKTSGPEKVLDIIRQIVYDRKSH